MRVIGRRAGALAALALLVFAGPAGAATLKAEYRLQGTRASEVAGAPALADLGPGNLFATEVVGSGARQVLTFPRGGGMSLATTGLVNPYDFSVVMVLRLQETSGYRRLLDFSGGGSDRGLYVLNGRVVLYNVTALYVPVPPVAAGSYVQITFVRGSDPDGTQWSEVNINGALVVFAETSAFNLDADVLRFFKDDDVIGGEESAGALSCVRVYNGVLTPEEVVDHAVDPTRCQPSAPPPPPPPPPAPTPPPAPAPGPVPSPSFRSGTFVGRTSQGLPISFTVTEDSARSIYFRWRARCADGRVRTKGMVLGGALIRDGRFAVGGVLRTGGRGRVSGSLRGERAHGTLSRWGDTAVGTTCRVSHIRWRARLVEGRARR